jgi:hypothetical protein
MYNADFVLLLLLPLLLLRAAGMQWWGHQLLDAIDSSLRRQYTLEGVYHWAFYRMVPPLLGAEVLVSCATVCNLIYII